MSTDGQPKRPQAGLPDWPGREQGVPPPPTPEGIAEISQEQGMITDEWAPAPAPGSGQDEGSAPTFPSKPL